MYIVTNILFCHSRLPHIEPQFLSVPPLSPCHMFSLDPQKTQCSSFSHSFYFSISVLRAKPPICSTLCWDETVSLLTNHDLFSWPRFHCACPNLHFVPRQLYPSIDDTTLHITLVLKARHQYTFLLHSTSLSLLGTSTPLPVCRSDQLPFYSSSSSKLSSLHLY